jgi:hypothetical protein
MANNFFKLEINTLKQLVARGIRTKGAALAAALLVAAFIACGIALANKPLAEPLQDEEFCNHLKIAGTGTIDIAHSVVDKKLALEYYNVMQGDGDIEMDSTSGVSQSARKIQAPINGSNAPVNLQDTIRLTYSGKTPLVGTKFIRSDDFWGGIGAEVKESFSVTEMDKVQNTYFASTNPATNMQNPKEVFERLKNSPVHAVGMDSKTSFNGTWVTDAKWHKIFYKNVKIHEAFTGKFEVEKSIQFHENPVPEQKSNPCSDLDC